MKILNLYAGIGGNRKLWGNDHEITAIEYNESIAAIYKDLYPNDNVIVADAHQYLLDHYKEYEDGFIWSSPPCPTHSKMNKFTRHKTVRYADMNLYQEIILLSEFFKGKYNIENVISYYNPLIPPQKISRHYFWSNFKIPIFRIKPLKNFTNASRDELMKWLDIYFDGNIYINGNHDPTQIFRNCCHPEIGRVILNQALGIIEANKSNQKQLFQ